MKTKRKSGTTASAAVAAICIVIYVFALIQAAVRIYLSIEGRRSAAEQEFSNIVIAALNTTEQDFLGEYYVQNINRVLSSNRTIEALIITGPGGEYVFERQQGYAVTWVNNSPRFINRFSFSKDSYSRPLPIQNLRNATVRAVAGAFDFDEISKVLKETLFLILIGFAVAFFTMLIQLLIGKPNEKQAEVITAASKQFNKNENESLNEPLNNTLDDIFSETNDKPVTAYKNNETEPKGLYSPRSNLGWEEYIKDRLDSEIHRCSSAEKDLTLVLMEFSDMTNDITYRLAAEEAITFFSSRDLLFEHGKHGILVIIPGVDLDTGISKSEKFYKRIQEKFQDIKSDLCIGLSSRSGRLIKAERLIFEAREALSKAKRDTDSSIIGFKSDPEKYRAFIANQN